MDEAAIAELEEQLRSAMLAGDVATLDRLLADDLIFTSHTGERFGKEDDLQAHRSKAVSLDSIELDDSTIVCYGDVAVVSVRAAIAGQFGGKSACGVFRFTRVWALSGEQAGRVLAGHSSLVSDGS